MAVIAVWNMTGTGSSESFVACNAGGDSFANDGRTYLHFRNNNAAARNVTIDSAVPCSFGFDHNVVVNVPATTGDVVVGPFPTQRFNDANGQVQLTYDAAAGLTVAVVRMP